MSEAEQNGLSIGRARIFPYSCSGIRQEVVWLKGNNLKKYLRVHAFIFN